MQKAHVNYRSLPSDLLVIALLGAVIYALVTFGQEWQSSFNPATEIELSKTSLPKYALFSALRGLFAFVISLVFTFVVGYWAAKSTTAEKFLIPLLDILQSIPVLGFLPGLVLALVALFPQTNTGLELASIIMIFTGQVWNMTFSFYSSLKSLPQDYEEVSKIIGLSSWEKLWRVETPFAMTNLIWNCLMSLSGGWFFLMVCEAFTLGDQSYRLPGLGAYMAVAIQKGDNSAVLWGIGTMAGLIVLMDIILWRPILAWAHQFRLDDSPQLSSPVPLMKNLLGESALLNGFTLYLRRRSLRNRILEPASSQPRPKKQFWFIRLNPLQFFENPKAAKLTQLVLALLLFFVVISGVSQLLGILWEIPYSSWITVFEGTLLTLLRVFGCLILGSFWAVPLAIWIGTSGKRLRIAQPIIQVLASFPAPMLYPLALGFFLWIRIPFSVSAMLLMLLGVQWSILFNVLAGAMRIPLELEYSLDVIGSGWTERWLKLYLPSIFPSLVTGWVTAAGGAWNASIVAEYLYYEGNLLTTLGLGSIISEAAFSKNFSLLAASLTVMVGVVVFLNRTLWAKAYRLAQTKYRLD